MFLLFENPTGYSLIKRNFLKEKKEKNFSLEFHSIYQFQTRWEAMKSTQKLIKGKVPKNLIKFIKNNLISNCVLVVNDNRLKNSLKKKLGENIFKIKKKNAIFRILRKNFSKLFNYGNPNKDKSKILSLTHSVFGEKIKIIGSKIDGMIIHAIRLFDEIEKSINSYSMRLREWYGWHFPELSSFISDNILFAKTVSLIETKNRVPFIDLSEFFSPNLSTQIKEASQTSFGLDIFPDDLACILSLSGQIIAFFEFRVLLEKYIKNRMYSLAPNLSAIVGEKIGARLIAHCGSLINLSKYPASTVQILGAEKALFKALKNKNFTPKYGLIYHASLIIQSSNSLKGKISRITSAKASLSARIDALGENKYGGSIGLKNKKKIEQRARQLESFLNKKKENQNFFNKVYSN
ncbi:nop5 (nucleomorph) [Hemiselmis andersenii]|uniref:Nop5 n=1 Tax=Hemiselmis andersenii TaxID=464988 RepID=A9BKJ0_HEMAN|nr:nop5 [Hemiselmis andersenii]ABW98161.1 nop5 [Hemiselmis andersenii]|mmetsp:Transcript_34184/g.83197  ORF Transcript_34184/g.83197 Transcript_34184/m.83197 type:complete len:406 (-) Transcript_34184:2214-3431(-)